MKRIFASHPCFLVIAFLVLAGFHPDGASGQDDLAVGEDRVPNKILAVLYPCKTATLSAEVLSVVKTLRLEMGETFNKDDILIHLDPTFYVAAKKKADAKLISANAAYRTNHDLYMDKSVSEIEFAKAKADLQIAKADVAIAKKELAACTIRAPYGGQVVKTLVNENELVQPGQPVIEIVDSRTMRARFMAPLLFYEHIQTGQMLRLRVRGADGHFQCRITHVSPVLESNTATFQVFGEIDNSKNALRGGMTGEITLASAYTDESDASAESNPATASQPASFPSQKKAGLENEKTPGLDDRHLSNTVVHQVRLRSAKTPLKQSTDSGNAVKLQKRFYRIDKAPLETTPKSESYSGR